MAIEYAPGGTLSDIMKNQINSKISFSDEQCSQIIKGVLLGLKHVH